MKGWGFDLLGVVSLAFVLLGGACGTRRQGEHASSDFQTVELEYCRLLRLEDHGAFTIAKTIDPWDTTKVLKTYALVDREGEWPRENYPGAVEIRVPLERAVIFSAVHNSLVNELGHPEVVAGVCDAGYIFEPWLKERLENGLTADCGTNFQPDVEKIISLSPQAVLLSPYEDMRGNSRIERAGIPVVECAEYMEQSPLGRAEWMKFYGRLLGEGERSDSLYSATREAYLKLKSKAQKVSHRPSVLVDRPYGGIWYVPSEESNVGILIKDSGGSNPFKNSVKTGHGLDFEQVLAQAGEADVWLLRHDLPDISYSVLGKEKEAYKQFRPYLERKIWETNTTTSHVFEDMSFHPQWLLEDLTLIFHPELNDGTLTHRYFKPMKP